LSDTTLPRYSVGGVNTRSWLPGMSRLTCSYCILEVGSLRSFLNGLSRYLADVRTFHKKADVRCRWRDTVAVCNSDKLKISSDFSRSRHLVSHRRASARHRAGTERVPWLPLWFHLARSETTSACLSCGSPRIRTETGSSGARRSALISAGAQK
jgi:hypothetical protein